MIVKESDCDGKKKVSKLENMMMKKFTYATTEHLVLLVPTNLKKTLVLRKLYSFAYLSDLVKSYLKVTLLALLSVMMNKYHLVY